MKKYIMEYLDVVGTGGNFPSVLIVEMGSEWYNIKARDIYYSVSRTI